MDKGPLLDRLDFAEQQFHRGLADQLRGRYRAPTSCGDSFDSLIVSPPAVDGDGPGGLEESRLPRVVVSPWIFLIVPIMLIFVGLSLGILILQAKGVVAVTLMVVLLIGTLIVSVNTIGSHITILDKKGFRVIPHRKVRWESVSRAYVEEIPAWIFPNYTIIIESKEFDEDGDVMEYTLQGMASFFAGRRLKRLADEINTWIAAAN